MNYRKILPILVLVAVFLLTLSVIPYIGSVEAGSNPPPEDGVVPEDDTPTEEPAPDNQTFGALSVTGYAWSSNIGWIHFNHARANPVTIDNSGDFTGYAWSSNIGWIDFAPSGPYPASPAHGAKRESNGSVIGWARAVSAIGRTDGWDGWIKLDHGRNEQVTINSSGKFDGYAWGDDVLGWIDFSPGGSGDPLDCDDPGYEGVCTNGGGGDLAVSCTVPSIGYLDEPTVFNATIGNPSGTPNYTYEWDIQDSSGDSIDVDLPEVHQSISQTEDIFQYIFTETGQYQGLVRVTDSTGKTSGWQECSVDPVDVDGYRLNVEVFGNNGETVTVTIDSVSGTCDGRCVYSVEQGQQVEIISNNGVPNVWGGSCNPSGVDNDTVEVLDDVCRFTKLPEPEDVAIGFGGEVNLFDITPGQCGLLLQNQCTLRTNCDSPGTNCNQNSVYSNSIEVNVVSSNPVTFDQVPNVSGLGSDANRWEFEILFCSDLNAESSCSSTITASANETVYIRARLLDRSSVSSIFRTITITAFDGTNTDSEDIKLHYQDTRGVQKAIISN